MFMKIVNNYKLCLKKIRINPQSSLHYSFVVPKKAILSKINQVPYSFSQIFEMRIAFF